MSAPPGTPVEGLLVVDKPAGLTSHDVVARVRRLARTRRVGHAGTLDPAATGVLVLGIGRATRLLGHLARTDKAYDAVARLGAATSTDDAEGEVLATADASGLTREDVVAAARGLLGATDQVPSAVSAVKVGGRRSYARVRAGEQVQLAPRPVQVTRLDVGGVRHQETSLDVELSVQCSSGTYVRALARDLGAALGVGGHLRSLRRTRTGSYDLAGAHPLAELERLVEDGVALPVTPLGAAAAAAFAASITVDAQTALVLGHGGAVPATGHGDEPVAVLSQDGDLVALVRDAGGAARPFAVFAPATTASEGGRPTGPGTVTA